MTDFAHIAADQMDQALFAALWSALGEQPFGTITLGQLADEVGIAVTDLYVRYADSDGCFACRLKHAGHSSASPIRR